MTNVGVVIPVYGDKDVWVPRAEQAAESVSHNDVIISIDENVCSARNNGAKLFKDKEYLFFLDADDAVHKDFFVKSDEWTGDIIKPDVYVNGRYKPFPINDDIGRKNYLIVGCPVKSELFFQHKGFDEDFPAFEDWHLWTRLIKWSRAEVEERHDSIYYYNQRPHSRNSSYSAREEREARRLLRQI